MHLRLATGGGARARGMVRPGDTFRYNGSSSYSFMNSFVTFSHTTTTMFTNDQITGQTQVRSQITDLQRGKKQGREEKRTSESAMEKASGRERGRKEPSLVLRDTKSL